MLNKLQNFSVAALLAISTQTVQAFEAQNYDKFLADDSSVATQDPQDHWAVVVAGSKDFWNYRHQADAAHARYLLQQNGVPEDQIIYMTYDDIPTAADNKLKGQLFNKKNGENVYDATKVTYRGDEVTAANFYAVLKGDAEATGGKPVLRSNSKSKVFVFFTDHGAPGLVQMPAGEKAVFADELQEVIDTMEEKKMYDEMVFYIEACESGSMFPKLREDQRVYAVTASNATQSSYATYCYPDDSVHGVSLGTCLGDQFSVAWMEDTEANKLSAETLGSQFEALKTRTSKSPVQKFGEEDIMADFVGEYLGTFADSEHKPLQASPIGTSASQIVDSRDAKLFYFQTRSWQNDATEAITLGLEAEKKHRADTDQIFSKTFAHHDKDHMVVEPTDFDCLRKLYYTYEMACKPFEDYSLKYVKHFVHACETESFSQVMEAQKSIINLCQELGKKSDSDVLQ